MQRGEALVVGLADISAAVNQLTDGGVLAIEAGQVQRRVPKGVGVVRLSVGKNETEKRTVVMKMSVLFCLCWVNTASCGMGTCCELRPDLHRQAKQVLHHSNLSTGSCGMEGSVASFVLAADLSTLSHQQTQNVQVSCRESAESMNKCLTESFQNVNFTRNLNLKIHIQTMTDIYCDQM